MKNRAMTRKFKQMNKLKTIVPLVLCFLLFNQVMAQKNGDSTNTFKFSHFLGLSTGINNDVGMVGISLESRISGITDNLALYAGIGSGSWGLKSNFSLNYYVDGYPEGISYSLGYSYASGLDGFEQEMEVKENGSTANKEITMDLHPAHAANFSVYYHWIFWTNFRFHLQAGYSLKVNPEAYDILTDVELTEKSEKIINMIQPGGDHFRNRNFCGILICIHPKKSV